MKGGKFALGMAYAAVALIVAFATAVAFFPYNALETRLESVVQERTGANIRLADTGYSLPLGLGADKAVVSHGSRELALELADVGLQWRPWGLLFGEQRFSLQAFACGGRIQSVARFSSLFLRDSGSVSLEVKDISLSECAKGLQLGLVSSASGRLEGVARVRNLKGGMEKTSGNASVKVHGASLALERGLLKGLAVKDAKLNCRLRKKKHSLRVLEARLDSPGIEASLNGEVRLRRQLEDSGLDLTAELSFHSGRLAGRPDNSMVRQALAQKGIDLVLKGTVGSPKVRMQ